MKPGFLKIRVRGAICVAIILCTFAVGTRAVAVEETADAVLASEISPDEIFVLGNGVFALLHEFGHAIIGEFDVPLLGLEENSADTIAAVSLILLDRRYPKTGYSAALGMTALVQGYIWQEGFERDIGADVLWAQHELSVQRFARITCLLYGSNPDRFDWVAEAADIAEIRAEGCVYEWETAERSFGWLVNVYLTPPVQPVEIVGVRYGPPLNDTETAWLKLLHRQDMLGRMAGQLDAQFAFPKPLTLVLTHCPVANAYWDPEYREAILCYELMAEFQKYAERPEVARVIERFRAR